MHAPPIIVTAVCSLGFALFSVSCGTGGATMAHRQAQRVLHGWHDDGGPGKVTIRISLPDQIAEFQRGGRDIGWCYVATGKEGHGTSPGSYRITEKIEDKYSNRYGWIEDELGNVVDGDAKPSDPVPEGMVYVPAPMPFWMRLTSYGIGMHGGFIPEPGKPASHGCIRLPKEFVPILFDSVEVGTPVTITTEPSKHLDWLENPGGQRGYGQLAADAGTREGRVIRQRPLNPGERPYFPPSGRSRLTDPISPY